MPLFADHNLYPGVNAHLNSYLQISKDGMWEPFHFRFIGQLSSLLDKILPPQYDVLAEKSLFDEEEELTSVVIYTIQDGQPRPVTRIELLSPFNKLGRSHNEKYIGKRVELVKTGLCLVEINFLHHSKPIDPALPVYNNTDEAAPYVILIHDPRPTFELGTTRVYYIGVVEPLPTIHIPLEGSEVVGVDFGAVYHEAFALRRFRSQVDYDTNPPAFDRFTTQDQEAIQAFLDKIRAQHRLDDA